MDSVTAHLASSRALPPDQRSLEVVLVDDASPDDSWQVILDLARRDQRIRGIALEHNVGGLMAVAAGCLEARGETVCVIDADLENAPEDLGRLLAALDDECDLVSAVRVDQRGRPALRRAASWSTRRMLAQKWDFVPRDFGCGMKVWRAEVDDEAGSRLTAGGGMQWAMDLFSAVHSYGEVEVAFHAQGHRSSYSPARVLSMGLAMLRTRSTRRSRRRRPKPLSGPPYAVRERC